MRFAIASTSIEKIKEGFRKNNIVVEQLDLMNAMGTFNVLNGEDRRVVAALVMEEDKSQE